LAISATVIISVGEEENGKSFTVHVSVTTKSSEFIQAALSNKWKEGQEKRINFPGTDTGTLEGYLDWLYSQQITLEDVEEPCGICEDHEGSSLCNCAHSLGLVKMYVLGDYLNDLRFCNAVMDIIKSAVARSPCVPNFATIAWVWEHTSVDCPVRECFLGK
jgi:hypothetical protein